MYSNFKSSFVMDDTSTIDKESPPFLCQSSDDSKTIHMENPSSCAFLNHFHTNLVNLTGSFIILPPPTPILKRKSRSLSCTSPQQSILLHNTIHNVKNAHEEALKVAFQMKNKAEFIVVFGHSKLRTATRFRCFTGPDLRISLII